MLPKYRIAFILFATCSACPPLTKFPNCQRRAFFLRGPAEGDCRTAGARLSTSGSSSTQQRMCENEGINDDQLFRRRRS